MIIEISGAGFHNMGAELMLVATRDQLMSWDTVEEVAISFRTGSRAQRQQTGCAGVLRLNSDTKGWANNTVSFVSRVTPPRLLQAVNLRSPAEVDALLDASGFSFGDQWGEAPALRSERLFRSFSSSARPIVLLPQAFGPFRRPSVAAASRSALEMVDMIYARDPESLDHLQSLGLQAPTIRLAPDFTNLVEPKVDPRWRDAVAVIPNARMIDMGASPDESTYLDFLRVCTEASVGAGRRVMIVAHEREDRELGRRLASDCEGEVSEHLDDDPVATKALVGGCALVVSSRYHGLVNALSQGVPAIGTGWSHKYWHLFNDYGCEDALMPLDDLSSARVRVIQLLQPESLDARRAALLPPAARLRDDAVAMWAGVREHLAQR